MSKYSFKVMAVAIFIALTLVMLWHYSIPVEARTHSRTFKATAYCGCRKCNGKWYGQPTASGTGYIEGRTVAVDRSQIKLGTHVWIDGVEYVAEDTGKGITWDRVDVYISDHKRASDFGERYVTVEWED